MAKPLRYTGCWPPVDILDAYPNWVLAIDEETEPDQDETTIKPEAQQAFISEETDYTAATVVFPGATEAVGILSLINGKIDAIDVFDGNDWWRLKGEYHQREWSPLVETWLPPPKRRPVVSMSDTRLFPMRVTSRLPDANETRLSFTVPLRSEPEVHQRKPWYKLW